MIDDFFEVDLFGVPSVFSAPLTESECHQMGLILEGVEPNNAIVHYPVIIDGETHTKEGVPYHITLRWGKWNDSSDSLVEKVREAISGLSTKRPKITEWRPEIFRGKDGDKEFHVLAFTATPETKALRVALESVFGPDPFPEFKPHISVDKSTWEKIQKEKLLPGDMGVEVQPLEVAMGNSSLEQLGESVLVESFNSLFDKYLESDKFYKEWLSDAEGQRSKQEIAEWFGLDGEFTEEEFQEAASNWFVGRFSEWEDEASDYLSGSEVMLFRCIAVNDLEEFLSALDKGKSVKGYKGLGVYWSWDEHAADCHWGGSGAEASVVVAATASVRDIDAKTTAFMNLDISTGQDEKEIRLKPGSKVKVISITDNNGEVLRDYESAPKLLKADIEPLGEAKKPETVVDFAKGSFWEQIKGYIEGEDSAPEVKGASAKAYKAKFDQRFKQIFGDRPLTLYRSHAWHDGDMEDASDVFSDGTLSSWTASKDTAMQIAKERSSDDQMGDPIWHYVLKAEVPLKNIYFHFQLDPTGMLHPGEKEVTIDPTGIHYQVVKKFKPVEESLVIKNLTPDYNLNISGGNNSIKSPSKYGIKDAKLESICDKTSKNSLIRQIKKLEALSSALSLRTSKQLFQSMERNISEDLLPSFRSQIGIKSAISEGVCGLSKTSKRPVRRPTTISSSIKMSSSQSLVESDMNGQLPSFVLVSVSSTIQEIKAAVHNQLWQVAPETEKLFQNWFKQPDIKNIKQCGSWGKHTGLVRVRVDNSQYRLIFVAEVFDGWIYLNELKLVMDKAKHSYSQICEESLVIKNLTPVRKMAEKLENYSTILISQSGIKSAIKEGIWNSQLIESKNLLKKLIQMRERLQEPNSCLRSQNQNTQKTLPKLDESKMNMSGSLVVSDKLPPLNHLPDVDQVVFRKWVSNPDINKLEQIIKEAEPIGLDLVWFARLKFDNSEYRGFCELIQLQTKVAVILIEVEHRPNINYKEKSKQWIDSKRQQSESNDAKIVGIKESLSEANIKLPENSELEQFYYMADRKANEDQWEEEAKEEFGNMDREDIEQEIEYYFNDANWDFDEWKEALAKMSPAKQQEELFSNYFMTYMKNKEESEDSSLIYFEDPKILGKTVLYRFTPAKPEDIMKSGFKGYGPERLGLTHHESPGIGDLSFAFEKKDLKSKKDIKEMSSKYGPNLFQFTVPYAVKAHHNTDYEDQVVFDVNTVSDLKFLGVQSEGVVEGFEIEEDLDEAKKWKFHLSVPQVVDALRRGGRDFDDPADFEEEAKDLIEFFESFPATIRLYRAVHLNNKDSLNVNRLGNHWTHSKEKAIEFARHELEKPWFLVTAMVDRGDVDWAQTLFQNIHHPYEEELYILNGKIRNPQVDPLDEDLDEARTKAMKIDGKEVEAILMAGGQGFKIYGVNGDSLVVVAGRNKLVVKEADPDFKLIMRYINLRYQNIDQHDQIKKDFQQIVSKMSDGVGESVDQFGIPLIEAEYKGREVELNKPMRGDVKKYKVHVKNDNDKVVKVNFGDKDMEIKRDDPERRKAFRARHGCDDPGPKHKAKYWSCKFWSNTPVSKLLSQSVDEWGIPMTEESELAKLKKAKKKLTDEERDEVMKAKAVWHHGPNGEETSAIWKAELNGKTYYCSNTHRAWSKSTTLKDAIKRFHEYVKESS